jgi:hypothetical protein
MMFVLNREHITGLHGLLWDRFILSVTSHSVSYYRFKITPCCELVVWEAGRRDRTQGTTITPVWWIRSTWSGIRSKDSVSLNLESCDAEPRDQLTGLTQTKHIHPTAGLLLSPCRQPLSSTWNRKWPRNIKDGRGTPPLIAPYGFPNPPLAQPPHTRSFTTTSRESGVLHHNPTHPPGLCTPDICADLTPSVQTVGPWRTVLHTSGIQPLLFVHTQIDFLFNFVSPKLLVYNSSCTRRLIYITN